MIKAAPLLLMALALMATLSIQAGPAGHYRWTDENGTVQYSDRPPEGIDAEFIKFSGGTKSSKSTGGKAGEESARADTGKDLGPMEVMPLKDSGLCEQARKNLQALKGARIRITEEDGSKRFLTEEEKEGQRENARKFEKINC